MKPLRTITPKTDATTRYSQSEKDFVDKHKIEVFPDAAGNGDEVFKASKVKTFDRAKNREGVQTDAESDRKVIPIDTFVTTEDRDEDQFDSDGDSEQQYSDSDGNDTENAELHAAIIAAAAEVNEEEINELSKKTLGNYVKGATSQVASQSASVGQRDGMYASDSKRLGPSWNKKTDQKQRKVDKRVSGINKAVNRLAKESEQLDELSTALKKRYVTAGKQSSRDLRATFREHEKQSYGQVYNNITVKTPSAEHHAAAIKTGAKSSNREYHVKKTQQKLGMKIGV